MESGELLSILDGKIAKEIEDYDKIAVVFSGGLDSTLIAKLASNHARVKCYTTGSLHSYDVEYAKSVADKIGLNLQVIEISKEKLEKDLPDLVKIGGTNPVKIGASVPLYYVCRNCDERMLLSGQGADEVFAGYHKYLRILDEAGYSEVEKEVRSDIDSMYEENLNRERRICRRFEKEIRYPFIDPDFVEHALQVPVQEKIKKVDQEEFGCVDELDDEKYIRKYFLRKVGEEANLPPVVLNRKKRAAQYGSRSHKMIVKLAKKHDFKKKAREQGKKHYLGMYLESLLE